MISIIAAVVSRFISPLFPRSPKVETPAFNGHRIELERGEIEYVRPRTEDTLTKK